MRVRLIGSVLTLLLVATAASEASAEIRRIGRCRARGDFAICVADGSVDNPSGMWVRVKALPNQSVSGSWDRCVFAWIGSRQPRRQLLRTDAAEAADQDAVHEPGQLFGGGIRGAFSWWTDRGHPARTRLARFRVTASSDRRLAVPRAPGSD
jgi:hypothetical protein